ncbi:MAG: metal-sulfur cluster assembly factor, partial [Bacteroidia bacterium]
MVDEKQIWKALEEVMDPEIPTISMVDLGIITHVQVNKTDNTASVTLIPTFSGCPALRVMEDMVREKVLSMGIKEVK